jgi:hypothetical protein
MSIRGETVTDISQRLLAQYGGLRGLFCMDNAEQAPRDGFLSQPLTPPVPCPTM